jgi:hypothetical protein
MSWQASDAKACAELRAYYASFPWRSLAVRRAAHEIAAKPRPAGPVRPLNHNEDYELPSRPGDALRNGMLSPGT